MSSDSASRPEPPFSPPDCPFVSMSAEDRVPPESAVLFGELEGSPVYVGRVYEDGNYFLGTALPEKGICRYINGKEEEKTASNYEILTVSCGEPLEFQTPVPDHKNLFNGGGNVSNVHHVVRIIDGGNTYIGWREGSTIHVSKPKGVQESGYEVLVHRFLDRLCICPPRLFTQFPD